MAFIFLVLSMRLEFPVLKHMVEGIQEAKETLADKKDHVDKCGKNVHSSIAKVVLVISLPPRKLDGSVADKHSSDHEGAGEEVSHDVCVVVGEPDDGLDGTEDGKSYRARDDCFFFAHMSVGIKI